MNIAIMALLCACCGVADGAGGVEQQLMPLLDPAKLATLGSRGANRRVQMAVYWLATGRAEGQKPGTALDAALRALDIPKAQAALTREALLRNLDIAEKLGCLDADGLAQMKKGQSPTIHRGPCTGQELTVDHVIPRSVCPELDNVIANLELMPAKINQAKKDKITARQISFAKKLHAAGLLSKTGLKAVRSK